MRTHGSQASTRHLTVKYTQYIPVPPLALALALFVALSPCPNPNLLHTNLEATLLNTSTTVQQGIFP